MPPEYVFTYVVSPVPELHKFQQGFNFLAPFGRWDTVEDAMQLHVFESGQFVIQAGILKYDAEGTSHQPLLALGIMSIDAKGAARRIQDRSEHFDGCRFSRSIGAQEPKNLPFRNGEGDVIHRAKIPVLLDQGHALRLLRP